jgi:hypothetical protein
MEGQQSQMRAQKGLQCLSDMLSIEPREKIGTILASVNVQMRSLEVGGAGLAEVVM